jgi:hypothetical protein
MRSEAKRLALVRTRFFRARPNTSSQQTEEAEAEAKAEAEQRQKQRRRRWHGLRRAELGRAVCCSERSCAERLNVARTAEQQQSKRGGPAGTSTSTRGAEAGETKKNNTYTTFRSGLGQSWNGTRLLYVKGGWKNH